MRITKLLNNHVLLQVDQFFGDSIKLDSGMVLYIDTTTQNPRYATTQGVVVDIPDSLVCCKPKNGNALEWETPLQIRPGDKVWFQYDALITAIKEPSMHYVQDGKLYILVNYRWLYVAKRYWETYKEWQTIPLNGYCLCEPVYADEYPWLVEKYFSSILVVDKHVKIPNVVKVKHLAEPNTRYQDKVYSDDMTVKEGDLVLTVKHADIPLEYDLYRSFDAKNEIYRVQRRNMVAVIGIEE